MPDSGLYPASEYKAGNHYKAFDWSGYDAEDIPASARRQMEADKAAEQQAYVPQARKSQRAASAFEKAVSGRKTKKTKPTQ